MKRLAAASLLIAGCTSHAPFLSRDVATRDISITVAWTDGGIRATATGPGGAITFEDGERMYLQRGPRDIALARDGDAWRADLGAESGVFVFALDRAWDTSARASFEVPAPFSVTTLPAVRARDPVPIAWTPSSSGGTVTIGVEGACVAPFSRTLATDTGAYTINPGELQSKPGAAPCDVTVSVTRALVGAREVTPSDLRFAYAAWRAARTTMGWTP